MDEKDVAGLTIAKCFNKKWWDKKRPFKVRGSGTGEALAEWEKHCPDDPATLRSDKALDAAEATCTELQKCLKVALGKVDKKDEHTTAGIKKMMKLLGEYEEKVLGEKKRQSNAFADLVDAMSKVIELARPEQDKVPGYKQTLTQIEKRVDEFAKLSEEAHALDIRHKGGIVEQMDRDAKTIGGILDALADVGKDIKSAEKLYKSRLLEASKDKRFLPHLAHYRSKLGPFDQSTNELCEWMLELKGKMALTERRLKTGESVDDVIEDLRKHLSFFQSPVAGHFVATLEILKERAPSVAEWTKNPSAMTEKQWGLVAFWEEEALGAQLEGNSLNQKLDRILTEVKRIGDKFGKNETVKQLVREIAVEYRRVTQDRATVMNSLPGWHERLQKMIQSR